MANAHDSRAIETIVRLAERTAGQPAEGIRGILTRRAWKEITSAGQRLDPGDRQRVYREVLAGWAAAGAPDDGRRGLLADWAGGEEQFARDISDMVMEPYADQRAAVMAFCVRNGIAPQRLDDRLRFFVLTGQREQWRALDPDGSLLAGAYRESRHGLRSLLREALTDEEPGLLRAVLVSGRLVATMPDDEIRYLAQHHLTPESTADQACFFALTGQAEQRLAVDPDGSLLAAAYRDASPDRQAALQTAMRSDAQLDVVRVVADGGQRIATITAAEREYLTGLLAERRDWAALWRLALELPVAEAVAAVRLADPEWRPDGQRDRELFSLLAGASPAGIRRAREAMDPGEVTHLEVPGLVAAGALSDDGRRVAVWTHDTRPANGRPHSPEAPSQGTVSIYSLPDGALVARHAAAIWNMFSLAYCDHALAAFTVRLWGGPKAAWLYHCPEDERPIELTYHYHEDHPASPGGTAAAMAAFRDGFVTARLGNTLGFHDSTGREVTTVRYDSTTDYVSAVTSVTVDHESGRIAVMRAHDGILLDGQRRDPDRIPVVGRLARAMNWRGICLRGADDLVVSEGRQLELWNFATHHANRSWFDERPDACLGVTPGGWDVTWIRARDEVCYLDGAEHVHYLDGATLQPVTASRELTGKTATVLFSSAAATCHGLGGDGYADIVLGGYPAIGKLADRPQAAWGPDDLRAIKAARRLAARKHPAQPLYQLVRACLEYRFGADR